jgi:hypothetical protein
MATDFWTGPLPSQLDWADVDAFLKQGLREGPRLEYRAAFRAEPERAPAAKKRPPRFADTVGAMANVGGGLVFFGVEQDEQDRPSKWPTLVHGGLKVQALEGNLRNYVTPYVPIETGVATAPDGRDVVVVRVPDAPSKPVFVEERGILVRQGEAVVPATVDQIRSWLLTTESDQNARLVEFSHYISEMIALDPPQVNTGAYPANRWHLASWGDLSDAVLMEQVAAQFPDVPHRIVDIETLDFRASEDEGDFRRWVRLSASGAILRRAELTREADGRIDLLAVASEIARTWELGRRVIPVVLPGYTGPIRFGLAIGGVTVGFCSRPGMQQRLEAIPRLGGSRRSFARWFEMPDGADSYDAVETALPVALRAFGYINVGQAISEAAFRSLAADSRQAL